jgi:hypothetical protein
MYTFQSEIASIGTDSNNSNEMGGNSPSSMISGASPVPQSPVPNCSSTTTTAATTTTSSSLTQNNHNDSTPAEFPDKKKQNDHNNLKVTVSYHLRILDSFIYFNFYLFSARQTNSS